MTSVKVYSKVDLCTFEGHSVLSKIIPGTGYGKVFTLTRNISDNLSFMMTEEYDTKMREISSDKTDIVEFVKFLLVVCENVSGKENKAFVAMKIYEFLNIHANFVFNHPKLHKAVVMKLLEFENEFPSNLLDGDFKELVSFYKGVFNCKKASLSVLCFSHFDAIISDPKSPCDDFAKADVWNGPHKFDYENRSAVFHVKDGYVDGDVVVTEKGTVILKCYYYHGKLYQDFMVSDTKFIKTVISGYYADSKLEGPYKKMMGDVEMVSEYYVKGVRKPTYTLRYENGKLRETSNAIGEIKMYSSTGMLVSEFMLVDGKIHGEKREYSYKTGKVKSITIHEHGKMLSYRRFDKSLRLKSENIYYPNECVRSRTDYYPNMKVKEEWYYYDGGEEGDESVRLYRAHFEDGSLKRIRKCDRSGKLLESFSVIEREENGELVRVSTELGSGLETVWKVCIAEPVHCRCCSLDKIRLIKMTVPASARRYQNYYGYYLVEFAFVEGVYYEGEAGEGVVGNIDENGKALSAMSGTNLEYKVGEIVYPDKYDPENSHGIYVFKYPEMALDYYKQA